jgi:hypothetical protein
MEAYYHGYFDPLQKALGPLFGKSLRYVMMDSWEAGTNNWTDEIGAEFQKRRGYNPTPYLPALTGHVVEAVFVDRVVARVVAVSADSLELVVRFEPWVWFCRHGRILLVRSLLSSTCN